MEILVGRLRIADLELNGLPFLHNIANDDGSGLLVGSDQIANEKISARELCALFIHGNTDMECPLGLGTFIGAQLSEDRL